MYKVDIYYQEEHINTLEFETWTEFLIWYPKSIEENACYRLLIEKLTKTTLE